MPPLHLGEVGTDVIEVDRPRRGGGRRLDGALVEHDQGMALVHGVASAHAERADDPADRGRDHVLHLHGFHDEELRAGGDRVSG